MEPQVAAAIVAGLFALLVAYFRWLLQKRDRRISRVEGDLARSTPEEIPGLSVEKLSWVIDIAESGSCSIIRQEHLHYTGNDEVPTRKRSLYHSGVKLYADSKHINPDNLNPDKEFKIKAVDLRAKVTLHSWTLIEDGGTVFRTTVQFDNPLSKQNPDVHYQLSYSNLDVSFFWNRLWMHHNDEWYEDVRVPVKNYKVTIIFPEKLPDWFREGEIGYNLTPLNWGEVRTPVENSRRTLRLVADNLEPHRKYVLKIDAGAIA